VVPNVGDQCFRIIDADKVMAELGSDTRRVGSRAAQHVDPVEALLVFGNDGRTKYRCPLILIAPTCVLGVAIAIEPAEADDTFVNERTRVLQDVEPAI
jgi:hypothetical protein